MRGCAPESPVRSQARLVVERKRIDVRRLRRPAPLDRLAHVPAVALAQRESDCPGLLPAVSELESEHAPHRLGALDARLAQCRHPGRRHARQQARGLLERAWPTRALALAIAWQVWLKASCTEISPGGVHAPESSRLRQTISARPASSTSRIFEAMSTSKGSRASSIEKRCRPISRYIRVRKNDAGVRGPLPRKILGVQGRASPSRAGNRTGAQ